MVLLNVALFEKVDGRDVYYDLILGVGNSTKAWKVNMFSNQKLTEKEVQRWMRLQAEAGLPVLTKNAVARKREQMEKQVKEFVYTDDHVEKVGGKKKKKKLGFFLKAVWEKTIELRMSNLRKQPINVLRKKRFDLLRELDVLRDNRKDALDAKEDEEKLLANLAELEEIIKEKSETVEKVEVKGQSFNKRVREKMYETSQNGEVYYGEENESAAKEPNPFVRRKTIQHTMSFGEEAERLAREEAEQRRKLEEEEKAAQEEKRRREEVVRGSELLSDVNALKRKKTVVTEERFVLQGLEGSHHLLAQAHNFDLDIDI